MRRTLLHAALMLAAACCVQGAGMAQNYPYGNGPQGSYLQSCQDIRTNDDRLTARCQTKDGNWRNASLNDYQRCTTDIGNDDGNLRCAPGVTNVANGPYNGYPNGNGNGQPQGSYLQSCQNIRTRSNRLTARCQTKDGNWRDTSMDNYRQCTTDIGNDDGNLRCSNGGYTNGQYNGYPNRNGRGAQGSYLQSCQNIRTRGHRLTARCQTKDGNWRDTSMNNYQRCTTDIGNDDGNLRCYNGGNGQLNSYGQPQGSYLQSCQNISVNGNDLRARCETKNGSWRDSSLSNYQRCTRDIGNDDGNLHCIE